MDSYFRFYKERFIAGLVVWGIFLIIYVIKEVLLCSAQYIQGFLLTTR